MSTILNQIWKLQNVSRVELVEHTGLTSGTITNLTHELIELKVIREYESVSGNVGRRRVMLGFDNRSYRIIGLYIGRSTIELVLMNLNGEVIQSIERDVTQLKGPEQYMTMILPLLTHMKKRTEDAGYKILGLGIAVPGPMDIEKGKLRTPPNFPGWSDFPIIETFVNEFGLPTLMDDDARTAALAERWYGLGRSVFDLVFITMGVGIGGGVISKGEIVRGTNGLCGQIGHMTMVMDGQLCDCGNRGCWETVGAIPGILSRWRGGDTMGELILAFHRGEPEAIKCIDDTLSYLETALINIYNMYDPEVIVLGGSLYPFLEDQLDRVRARLKSRSYAFARESLRVEQSKFGTSQSTVGAAAMLFRELLTEPLRLLDQSGVIE